MPRYDETFDASPVSRQRDLVLSSNEFCFLQSRTNGVIKTYTGPITMTISAQEALVTFNKKTKMFEETQDFEKAKQLFTSAPEGWYIVLKNPSIDGSHPEAAKAVNSPDLTIGHKINIAGPVSFSLFPGQMAKVVQGHRLRSNQYLIARVYDAEAAKANSATATIVDTTGNDIKDTEKEEYFVGQLLVIEGTKVSFYIPPTGIEVIPDSKTGEYVRDAVTLERLEYAILKDEDGEKRYIHGPAVVFPKPTETFVTSPKNTLIFRALELSPISGIYIKVIAAYDEQKNGKKIHHPIGEELFITGNDQMIYYPRPEHALIQYDGKYMHHAIAIPEGEGRYVLNRLSGEITTVKGPRMYLPDPRTEVIVKRKLTPKECSLLYPNNIEVLQYNQNLTEQTLERKIKKGLDMNAADVLNAAFSTADQESSLAIFEANASISRGVSYTKPRTITLDTKYEGVVSIDVWGGYGINVVSKSGKRDVVVGPTTVLLDYNQTVEPVNLSTGRPKNGDKLIQTAFLKIDNNRVSDAISARTADGVNVVINLYYFVNFLPEFKERWFAIDNYVKYLCDNMRSLVKKEVKKYDVKDFYNDYTNIIRNIVLDIREGNERGRLFEVNGMLVTDVDIIDLGMDVTIAEMFREQQEDIIEKSIQAAEAERRLALVTAIQEKNKQEQTIKNEVELYGLQLEGERNAKRLEEKAKTLKLQQEIDTAAAQAKADIQVLLNAVHQAELERKASARKADLEHEREEAAIGEARQAAYAKTVSEIMDSISPDLVAAITASSNAELLASGMKNMSPYALANGMPIPEVVNTLVRGTPLENVINKAFGEEK